MQTRPLPKGIFFGFTVVGFLFIVLYIVLSFHNRPAADDFYFLGSIENKGIWNTALTAYKTWITRWTSLLFIGAMVKFFTAGQSLLWFHLFTLLALIAGLALIIRKILLLKFNSAPQVWFTVIYSILFVSSFFMLSFSTGETWFWFTSVCMYLWPVIILIYGDYLLHYSGKKIFYPALLFFCFLFIGGGSEVVALEVLLLLVLLLWNQTKNKSLISSQNVNSKFVTIALAALTISLLIAWCGPGRIARQAALPDASFGKQLLLSVLSSAYFLFAQLPLKIHWIIFYTIPWIVLKNKLIPAETEPVTVIFKSIARDFIIFLGFVVIHFMIVVFLLKSFPPYRTWITLSFALSIFCSVTGWRLGYLMVAPGELKIISSIFIAVNCILFIYYINTQQQQTSAYSTAADNRMSVLKNSSEQTKPVIELIPLPAPGLLYSAEISSDTNHFTNKYLKEYMHLKIPIKKSD